MTAYLEVKFREIKPKTSVPTGLLQKMETFQKQHKYHFDTGNYFTWNIFIYSQHISGTNPHNKHMKESKYYHEKKLKDMTSITLGFCFWKRAINKLVFHNCWRRTKKSFGKFHPWSLLFKAYSCGDCVEIYYGPTYCSTYKVSKY